jgi:hypothetical protein
MHWRCADYQEIPMRIWALTILTVGMVLAAGQTQAQNYGFWPPSNAPDSYCQFSSYAQCMATASGTNAYCGINPQYAFARQRRGVYRDRY